MTPLAHPFTLGLALGALWAGMIPAAITITIGRIALAVVIHSYARMLTRVWNERKSA